MAFSRGAKRVFILLGKRSIVNILVVVCYCHSEDHHHDYQTLPQFTAHYHVYYQYHQYSHGRSAERTMHAHQISSAGQNVAPKRPFTAPKWTAGTVLSKVSSSWAAIRTGTDIPKTAVVPKARKPMEPPKQNGTTVSWTNFLENRPAKFSTCHAGNGSCHGKACLEPWCGNARPLLEISWHDQLACCIPQVYISPCGFNGCFSNRGTPKLNDW